MTSQAYTLETIHADALNKLQELRDAGKLSSADYDMITGDSKPEDVLSFMNDAILRHASSRSIKNKKVHENVKPLLDRVDRFGSVIDILASSSPQVHGVNPARLVWGALKFVVLIARDIVDTFDAVLTMLEDIVKALPTLQTYINMFGSSQLQLLREPLVDIYAGFIGLGLQAIKLCSRSTLRTLGRSVWSSLAIDFKELMSRIEKNRTEVDRIAEVEHMHQATGTSRVQLLENQKAEVFRNEQRSLLADNSGTDISQTSPLPLSFVDAPLDLLSVHSINRTNELARLDDIFSAPDPHVPRRCAIHGMPGLGKTQLALRYAKLVFDRKQYPLVFWISAATSEKLNQGFANILNPVNHVDRNHPEQSARLIAARRWLEGYHPVNSNAWLLVIDNANRDSVTFLREHLPRSSYGGSILFTTRTDDVAQALASSAGHEHHTFGLQAPTAEDAARIILDHAGLDTATVASGDMDKAKEIVDNLGRLPLAVDQAASLMRQSHTTMDELLKLYRSDQKIEAISWENDLSTYEQASVAAAFRMQFEELSRLSPDSYSLMRILSFLDPESISPNVITDGVDKLRQASLLPPGKKKIRFRDKLKIIGGRRRVGASHDEAPPQLPPQLDSLLALLQSPMQFQKAIHLLQSLSLLQQQTGETTPALRIHDLVQFMTQENTRIESVQQNWLQCAVTLVCGAFEQVEDPESPTFWPQHEMFVPHIESLTKYADLHNDENLLLLDANSYVARYWKAGGRYREAESLYRRVLAGYDKLLGPTHKNTLVARDAIANILGYQGMYKESVILLKQVLQDMKQFLGPTHRSTLVTMHNLANHYMSVGSYGEAEALYTQVLEESPKTLEPDHPSLLSTSGNLAHVYFLQGQCDKAESLYKQVLEGRERQLGSEHPQTLWTMSALASVYSVQGQHVEAESLFKQALESQERQLGPEHPQTLWTMFALGDVYSNQGRYVEARPLYQKAVEGQERQLGSEHPHTLLTMSALASVYSGQGQYVTAESLYQQALEGQERQLGSEHLHTLSTLNSLGLNYSEQGRHEEAIPLFKRALAGRERQLGLQHPNTILAIHGLTYCLEAQGRFGEAAAIRSKLPLEPPQASATEPTADTLFESPEASTAIGVAPQLQGTQSRSKAGLRRFFSSSRTEWS